jgi:AAHS family 4-hydroxybenzoate transporter-like MFS transporter
MAACTLLTCFAGNEAGLFAVRFLIGIGFGAAVPTAFSMTSDYAPARHRSVIIMATMSGIALGMALAGVAAAFLIPAFGWKSLLLMSGSLSLVWVVFLVRAMPESLAYLVDKRPASPQIARIAMRLAADRGEAAAPLLVPVPRNDAKSPLREVVSDGRGLSTVLLWAAMSAVYALEFFTSYWLPTVLLNSGANMFAAGMISAVGKVGSITGAVVIGTVMDRFGGARVLSVSYLATAGAILVLGFAAGGAALSIALIVAMFFLLDGSFAGIQALTAASYPSHVRATGIGWVTGLARLIGGGSGTFAGGYIVRDAIPLSTITMTMAAVMVFGAAVMVALRRRIDARPSGAGRRSPVASPTALPAASGTA